MEISTKIAAALARVRAIANGHNAHIVQTNEITRADRENLIRTHWLQEIVQGWYMLTRPDLNEGDSAAWYMNFWDFLRLYLHQQYGNDYCLSAETSLELHTKNTVIPNQVIVIIPKGGTTLQLPFSTSILTYADPKNIPNERIKLAGLQAMTLPYALCRVSPIYFQKNPENAEIALNAVRSSFEISKIIIENNFIRAAERLLGAYQFLGKNKFVDEIKQNLTSVGINVFPSNPFIIKAPMISSNLFRSPYENRIYLLWNKYRQKIIELFPKEPGLPKNKKNYLEQVEKLYEYDAYNSLSIEGYQVTPELIERVRNNHWKPDFHQHDNEERNALAARGYYEAFQSVKITLEKILQGESPGKCISDDLNKWYQALFSPCIRANILLPTAIIGYRNDRVYIRNSRHAPPAKEALLDCMDAFFSCLQNEEHAGVRAILGHYIFVYIHPFMDGNGRIARFILNTMLVSGGYQWTIVQNTRRKEYINSLEATNLEENIEQFCQFILSEMEISNTLI